MSEMSADDRRTLLLCGRLSSFARAEALLADLQIEVERCPGLADVAARLASGAPTAALLCAPASADDSSDWDTAVAALEARGVPWLGLTHDGADRPGDLERSRHGHGFVTPETLVPVLPVWLRPVLDLAARTHELSSLTRTLTWLRSFQQLGGSLEAGHLHPLALDLLMEACGREQGVAVFLRDGPGKGLATALRGFDEPQSDVLSARLVDDKPLDLAAVGGLAIVRSGPVQEALRAAGVPCDALLQVPVEGRNGPTGALFLPAGERALGDLEISAARMLLEHVRVALRNVETYLMAKERAFVDDVTDLYNARYLIQTADNEIQRADRYGNPLSVLFLDLDRFKRVNDEWGHLIGSDTLRKLSQLLSSCVRQVDTLARYGGDEFTILLVDTDHNAAVHVAERIRRIVEETVFEVGGEARLHLTVSIGVATCPDHATTREPLLDAADKAMYRAKSDGRNRVCSAHELEIPEPSSD